MSHISFSELSKWNFCPFARKLAYEDRIRNFQGNIFTAFGLAIHAVCEKYFETNKEIDKNFFFGEVLRKELRSLEKKNIYVDGKKIKVYETKYKIIFFTSSFAVKAFRIRKAFLF